MRSSGVFPTSRVIESGTPGLVITPVYEPREAVPMFRSREEVDEQDADAAVDGAHRVGGERAAHHGAPLGGQDVQDRLADQETAPQQGEAGPVLEDAVAEDG